jgi:RNA polymerase sigma-70 factor (ECF subfamily)
MAAQAVRFALERLPEAQREVIALHWFGGVPLPEVAEVVGASLSAVKVRAHRGYAAMRQILENDPGNPRVR